MVGYRKSGIDSIAVTSAEYLHARPLIDGYKLSHLPVPHGSRNYRWNCNLILSRLLTEVTLAAFGCVCAMPQTQVAHIGYDYQEPNFLMGPRFKPDLYICD